jgi:cytochrome P450
VTTSIDQLPNLPDAVEALWGDDMAGAGDLLLESGATGLYQLLPGMIVAFRHDDVLRLASNPGVGNVPADVLAGLMAFIGYDDPTRGFIPLVSRQVFAYNAPLHAPARRILTRQMTPSNIGRFDAVAIRLLESILDEVSDGRPFDLCRDLAFRLTAGVFGTLIGLDADETDEVRALTEAMSLVFLNAPTPEDVEAVSSAVERYMAMVTRAADRTLAGGRADPLAREVMQAFRDDLADLDVDGAPETAGLFAAGNFFDGFHTAGAGIANALVLLAGHPDLVARVRKAPSLASRAYDEATRLAPPLIVTNHLVIADTVHDDVTLPEGTVVVLDWGAANRDPAVFENPTEFDLDRPLGRLLTFGRGPHICPGRSMSRRLGELAINAVLDREWDLVLDPTDARWVHGASATQMTECPVHQRPRYQ